MAMPGVFGTKRRSNGPPEIVRDKAVLHKDPRISELLSDLARYAALMERALEEIREGQRMKRGDSDEAR